MRIPIDIKLLAVVQPTDDCKSCGKCCKNMPGTAIPSDFGMSSPADIEKLRPFIESQLWHIDRWEADSECPIAMYYVRPAIVDAKGPLDLSWGGRCTFLTNTGCNAPFKPHQCSTLTPSAGGANCTYSLPADKLDYAYQWEAYQEALLSFCE